MGGAVSAGKRVLRGEKLLLKLIEVGGRLGVDEVSAETFGDEEEDVRALCKRSFAQLF